MSKLKVGLLLAMGIAASVANADPIAVVSTPSINFGDVCVGQMGTRMIALTNAGDMPLLIYSIIASDGFGQENNCGSILPAGESCLINLTFDPSQTGDTDGTLTISDNGI
jgi:Abnormal spindle-like microcephaly-assoc'd, ASPM-SPD-2-Hydin